MRVLRQNICSFVIMGFFTFSGNFAEYKNIAASNMQFWRSYVYGIKLGVILGVDVWRGFKKNQDFNLGCVFSSHEENLDIIHKQTEQAHFVSDLFWIIGPFWPLMVSWSKWNLYITILLFYWGSFWKKYLAF